MAVAGDVAVAGVILADDEDVFGHDDDHVHDCVHDGRLAAISLAVA